MGKLKAGAQPCPCGESSDAYAIYTDNSGFCFSCSKFFPDETHNQPKVERERPRMEYTPPDTAVFKDILDRGIRRNVAEKYGILSDSDNQYYPYHNKKGELSGYKIRHVGTKGFRAVGGMNNQCMFGRGLFASGGKYITITEGELDCAATWQMTNGASPVVSVPSASVAESCCKAHHKFIDGFDNIVICFDDDQAGRDAAIQVAKLFEPGKAKIMKMEGSVGFKDACDYLRASEVKRFTDAWWRAEPYKPQTITNFRDMYQNVLDKKGVESVPYPWPTLTNKTYGHRLGELVSIKAPPKVGKTQVLREIAYSLLQLTKSNIGTLFLEEDDADSVEGLMSIHANKRFHLPDTEYTLEEHRQAFEETAGTGRIYAYSGFGSRDIQEISGHIRYYNRALGCDYVILDHISILVGGGEAVNERLELDKIAHTLKSLTIELGCTIFVVSHVNDDGKFRGSRALQQLSNTVIGLRRDKMAEDPELRNTLFVDVEECRFSGDTGPADKLLFDLVTGRLNPKIDEDFDD